MLTSPHERTQFQNVLKGKGLHSKPSENSCISVSQKLNPNPIYLYRELQQCWQLSFHHGKVIVGHILLCWWKAKEKLFINIYSVITKSTQTHLISTLPLCSLAWKMRLGQVELSQAHALHIPGRRITVCLIDKEPVCVSQQPPVDTFYRGSGKMIKTGLPVGIVILF